MDKNYPEILEHLAKKMEGLSKDIPGTMHNFMSTVETATKAGKLSQKTKELIALCIGVAVHCEGCIAHHMHALVELGVTEDELDEALAVSVFMGGGPSVVYASDALLAFKQFTAKK